MIGHAETQRKDVNSIPSPRGRGTTRHADQSSNQGEVLTPPIEKSVFISYIPSHQVLLGGKDVKKR